MLLGGIAEDASRIQEPLLSLDCKSTLGCLRSLGVGFEADPSGSLIVHPPKGWSQPEAPLDCGNSGTTMRLLSGLVASRPLEAVLVGDESLSRRPMRRIADPLRAMGAGVEGDTPPLKISGSAELRGIDFQSPVASAQVKSCVLLAGLRASGSTSVEEPLPTRDHTERMLSGLGVEVQRESETKVRITGGSPVPGFEFLVPADFSSAAFFVCAAAAREGSALLLRNVGLNPTRTGLLDILDQIGARYEVRDLRDTLGEPVGDLWVEGRASLSPYRLSGSLVPRLIDEIPVLAVLATQLNGVSTIRNAEELRVKESDRIRKAVEGLRAMGAKVEEYPDGMDIEGPVRLSGAVIDPEGDHRIAMAFAIAAGYAKSEVVIRNAETIETSYPGFLDDLRKLQT
ncbi:MAG: 3-phosphoshikimate 1-carboxyvinyltransferase [Chthonomonadaceae bacterium]